METPISEELIRRTQQIDRVFLARRITHAFMGGLAMNVWTIPVPTYDIDVCADLQPDGIPDVLQALKEEGFIPPATSWLESVGEARFQEFSVHWPFSLGLRPADIFLASDPFQKEALAHRTRVEMEPGFWTEVVTPEDLLIYKLVANRKKDQAAIERLLTVQRDMNWAYVRGWARRFQIEGRLDGILRDLGFDPLRSG